MADFRPQYLNVLLAKQQHVRNPRLEDFGGAEGRKPFASDWLTF
jgi:hypothetical protein